MSLRFEALGFHTSPFRFHRVVLEQVLFYNPKLLFAFQNKDYSELLFFSSPQPHNPDENCVLVASNYQMKFSSHGCIEHSSLVHGLICLKDSQILKGEMESVLQICNPSTGQTLILPKMNSHSHFLWLRLFGYDPIGKQYKVLAMTRGRKHGGMCDEYKVLTLGSGNMSWKMIDCCIPHSLPWKKICINGVLYYTSIEWPRTNLILIGFDVRFEKFSLIKTDGTIDRVVLGETTELVNYNGKLGLLRCEGDLKLVFIHGGSIKFKLWVLEDMEKQEWSEHTFLFSNVPKYNCGRSKFVGMTKNNEIVLSSTYQSYPSYDLFYLNLEKKTIVRVEIKGMNGAESGSYYTFLDHVEDVKLY